MKLLACDRTLLPPEADGMSTTLEFVEGQVLLRDLRRRLGMPTDLPRIALLRGEPVHLDHGLVEGDEVVFVTLLGGG